jgi:hypothetical protein
LYGFDAIRAVSDDEKNALRRRKRRRESGPVITSQESLEGCTLL